MIELYEYLLLNRDEKANYLWEHGEFIINLKEPEHSFNLYTLNGYFVEVAYSNTSNSITDIKPFKKGCTLDKYIDLIQVTRLE